MTTNTQTGALVVRAEEGTSLRWGPAGTLLRIIAGADSTDGSFSVVEAIEPPGSGAPPHVHNSEAEAFYILEGALKLTCGEQSVVANAGDFVYTPSGVPHTYSVVSESAARVLLLFSRPGFENFFAEAGSPLDEPPAGPPDFEAFKRIVEKYDMELLDAPGH